MFLKRIRVENVRALHDAELVFDELAPQDDVGAGDASGSAGANGAPSPRRWTMILGDNGIGKSTLLRSIALVTAGSAALAELIRDVDSWIRVGEKRAIIEAELQTAAGEPRNVRLELRRGAEISDVLRENESSLAQIDSAFRYSKRSYFVVGYGVSRRLPRINRSTAVRAFSSLRAGSVGTLFDPDVPLNSLEAWAIGLHYRRGARALKLVRETLDRTLPNVRFTRVDKKRETLMFESADGEVPLSMLGDGYQNVAGWLGDLLFRITETFEDYSKPLDTRGLLLVDELDLHLHPLWQRQVRDFLMQRLPNFQFVVTTHSALAAHQTRRGELYFLRRERKTPVLRQFEADASKLALTQLIASPLFGLQTLDSLPVQRKKEEYRALKERTAGSRGRAPVARARAGGAKQARSAAAAQKSRAKLKALAAEIAQVPTPLEVPREAQEMRRTLEKLRATMARSRR